MCHIKEGKKTPPFCGGAIQKLIRVSVNLHLFFSSPYTRVQRKGVSVANTILHGPSSITFFSSLFCFVLHIYILMGKDTWGNP